MGPIVCEGTVVPHIKRVRIIEAVVTIVDGILGHLPPFIARSVEKEEFLNMVVDDILGRGRNAGSG